MHIINLFVFFMATASLSDVAAEGSLSLSVCFNYGCKSKEYIKLTNSDIDNLHGFFINTRNARHEREQIGHAIAKLEQIVGRNLPTRYDVGGNYSIGMVEEGQQDCIDESINTTNYLNFFEAQGWLQFHSVLNRVKRAPLLFNDHWTAVIQVKATGQLYAVDSWVADNGKLPAVQKLEDWYKDVSYETSE